MSALKDNPEDVLHRKHSNQQHTPSSASAPVSVRKASKFKPALSTPIASSSAIVQKPSSTTLPSFSTPGFRVPKPNAAVARTRDVIDISSDSTPSSPTRAAKRTSSDFHVTSDPSPQSPKRPKRDFASDKENLSGSSISARSAKPQSRRFKSKPIGNDEDGRMDLDERPKPHEGFSSAVVIASTSSDSHSNHCDLLSETDESLNQLLLDNQNLKSAIMETIIEGQSGSIKSQDKIILKTIKDLLSDRISAITATVRIRESNVASKPVSTTHSQHFTPEFQATRKASIPVRSQLASSSGSYDITTFASTSINPEGLSASTSTSTSTFAGSMDFDDDHLALAPSETDYWEGIDDIYVDGPEMPPSAYDASEPSDLTTTPYYPEIKRQLQNVFKLTSFRTNQLNAITETMAGRDVFVLMPTGGGKSLCYQLPATCKSGKTKGTTVVVSPLLALMKDQVDALKKKNINVFLWNSETSYEEVKQRLYNDPKPDLMYITPEKLKESNISKNALSILHKRNELARFVIDEAHCISTWGQDFREAYKDLGSLREDYPGVPIMALTATANEVTIDDIVKQLRLNKVSFFKQSFNRENLSYHIYEKKKTILQDIMNYIKSKHANETGIIYCMARKTCEKVAKVLRDKGFNAQHFHAKMTTKDKDITLDDWRSGKCHIIVATIAFGMGIDKAEVRFVIHHDLPKSMDGYYQETGRAGRDGDPADCVLYYGYPDFQTILWMINNSDEDKEKPTKASIDRQTLAARAVLQFCENKSECRRVQLLQYFGEKFDKTECRRGCDNCAHEGTLLCADVTEAARHAIDLVQTLQEGRENVTVNQCQAILRGAQKKEIKDKQHDKLSLFGAAKQMPSDLMEHMFQRLLFLDILTSVSRQNASGYHNQYVELGVEAKKFRENNEVLEVQWRPKLGKPSNKLRKQPPVKTTERRPPTSKGKQRAVVEVEEPIEMYQDDSSYEASEYGDDKIEMEEHSKATWPPVRAAARRTVYNHVVAPAAVCDDADPTVQLYDKMRALRQKLMDEQDLPDEDDVLDDAVLQCLSATCPEDYKAFKGILKIVYGDTLSGDELSDHVNTKFDKFGMMFLDFCIAHKVNSARTTKRSNPVLNSVELHSRYDYHEHSSSATISSASSSVPKSKFKPQRIAA